MMVARGAVLVGTMLAIFAGALAGRPWAQPAVSAGPQRSPPAIVPGGPAARARFTIKAEKGFIDDAFALDEEAGALGVLLTDAASFARVDLVDLATGKPRATVELGDPQRLFERVVLVGGGKGLVLVSRDAGSGKRSAQYFDPAGKPGRLVGPFTDFGVATRRGDRFLVTWSSAPGGSGATVYTVARHRLAGLDRLGKPAVLVAGKEGALRKPEMKAIAWQDGFTQVVGVRPGAYDEAKDVRLPDGAAVYDVLEGRFSWEGPIGDVYAWAAATELRRKLPGRSLFAVLTPDARSLHLLDFLGRQGVLEPAVPLRLYDPTTLQEHEDPASGRLLFSLAIDPLNPDALSRKKKDPSFLDLYAARPGAPVPATGGAKIAVQLERLLRAPMDDRPVVWIVGTRHTAVLRKHKNFSRGGAQLELYAND